MDPNIPPFTTTLPQSSLVDMCITEPKQRGEFDSTQFITSHDTPTTPPRTTAPLPRSTPIKVGSSTTCPFTTNQKFRVDACTAMGEEIKKYLVGPMPAQQFLDDFFPVNELSGLDKVSKFKPNCYRRTIKAQKETDSYEPFVSPSDGLPFAGLYI